MRLFHDFDRFRIARAICLILLFLLPGNLFADETARAVAPQRVSSPRPKVVATRNYSWQSLAEPENLFWPGYFWFWNGPLKPEVLREQLADMASHDARSVCVVPIPSNFRNFNSRIDVDYLSPEFFNRVKIAVDEAARLGMNYWLYDEGGWPSGTACGLVISTRPESAAQILRCNSNGEWTPKRVAPAVNYFDAKTTDAFIELTHDRYAKAIGSHFGKTIKLAFSDEPKYVSVMPGSRITWADDADEIFRRRFGYSLLGKIDAFRITKSEKLTPEQKKVRVDYFDFISQRFCETFFAPLLDWNRKHGIAQGGHLGGEDETFGAVRCGFGHVMRPFREMDVPGVDVIWRQVLPGQKNHHFPKFASSVIHQNGAALAFTESFCVYGANTTPAEMKWVIDYQYVRGLTLAVLGVYHLSTRDHLMTDQRPQFGPVHPLWDFLPDFHRYVARLGYVLSCGKPDIDVGLYYPVRDIWASGDPADPALLGHDALARALLRRQCDFDIVDDDVLSDPSTRVENGRLAIGSMRYRTIVVGPTQWMTPAARQRLETLAAAGGQVIRVDNLRQIDATVAKITPTMAFDPPSAGLRAVVRRWPGGGAAFVFNEGKETYRGVASLDLDGNLYEIEPATGLIRTTNVVTDSPGERKTLALSLEPWQSMLLVSCSRDMPDDLAPPAAAAETIAESVDLSDGWTARVDRQYVVGERDFQVRPFPPAEFKPVSLGRWAATLGLGKDFSGRVTYRRTVNIPPTWKGGRLILDLGGVEYGCRVLVDDRPAGCVLWSPWRIELPMPKNRDKFVLKIEVANTFANEITSPRVRDEWAKRKAPGWPSCYQQRQLGFEMSSPCGGGLIGPISLKHQKTQTNSFKVERLRCEYQVNPQGIDAVRPRLSWTPASRDPQTQTRGARQTAYQVLVSSSRRALREDRGDLWDSGKVLSDALLGIVYSGRPLTSWKRCFWKVRVWDENGRASDWSRPAAWSIGLLRENDWKGAQWIGIDEPERPVPKGEPPESRRLTARQLRREFDVTGTVHTATAAFSGLGLSELYVNGDKVGDEVLSPPLTDYDKRAVYVVHDVTKLLKPGRNAVGVWLGNGRYWAPRLTRPTKTRTFGPPKLRLILRIEYADGMLQEIVSDNAWKATDQGPIRANNEYDGEHYDARMELPGWAEAGCNDADWKSVDVLPAPGGVLSARRSPPIRVIETRKPIAHTSPKPGVYIFDLGQNIVGWRRLRVKGPAGTTVRLRHAERLKSDGTLSMANLRHAQCTDLYTLKGEGVELYEPRFTYHGFRYVELTGYPGEPSTDAVEACVVHDDLEPAGDFSCSNELLNRIHANCRWGIRGNYRSVPTDCPQRDERQAWLGDRATGCRGETQLFNVAAFYEKWLIDVADAQRPDGSVSDVCPAYWPFYNDNVTWAGTIALIPDVLREQYGDERFIVEHYPAMRAWIEHMCGFIVDDRMPRDTYGDWCVPPEDPKLIHTKDPARKTNGELIATAYFYHILQLMSRYAVLADRPEDSARYAEMARRMASSFNKHFFHAEAARYGKGTQTSSLLPLSFGLTPRENRAEVFRQLTANIEGPAKSHVAVGLIGIQHLMRVLSDNGRPDLSLRIATQEDYPSWGYMVRRGATTVWELWNGDTAAPKMNSGNHVMLIGDLLPWMYEYLAGIRPDPSSPGYRRVVLKPVPLAEIDFVRAWRQTTAGRIESRWRRENGNFFWDVSIPIGAVATVYVPAADPAKVLENGKPARDAPGVKFLRQEPEAVVYEVGAGNYRFCTSE